MSSKLPSILIGAAVYVLLGLLASVLSSMGSAAGMFAGILSCVTVLLAAATAVWHYTSTNALTISGGQGAGMGVVVGLVGAVIAGSLSLLLIQLGVLPDPMDIAREQWRTQGLSEEQIEQMGGWAEAASGPIGIVIGAAVGMVLGAAGGAIGAAIFKKGEPDRA
ncbi:MAG: hypothetical protein AAF089_04895 [Bacteroidota bacterium]